MIILDLSFIFELITNAIRTFATAISQILEQHAGMFLIMILIGLATKLITYYINKKKKKESEDEQNENSNNQNQR